MNCYFHFTWGIMMSFVVPEYLYFKRQLKTSGLSCIIWPQIRPLCGKIWALERSVVSLRPVYYMSKYTCHVNKVRQVEVNSVVIPAKVTSLSFCGLCGHRLTGQRVALKKYANVFGQILNFCHKGSRTSIAWHCL